MSSNNIYCITNIITGKKYIGKTKHTIEQRFKTHCYRANYNAATVLHNSIVKHGSDNFIVECIESGIPDDIIDSREIFWIKEFNTKLPYGYNMTSGGSGIETYKHTEYTKKIMSERHCGGVERHTQETKKKISNSLLGKVLSENTKINMYNAQVERHNPDRIPYVLRDKNNEIVCIEYTIGALSKKSGVPEASIRNILKSGFPLVKSRNPDFNGMHITRD